MLHFDKLSNIETQETSVLRALDFSPDLLVKPPELYGMPPSRNEYYRIGTAVLDHMKRSNPSEKNTSAGKATLDLMESALRDDKSCTLSPEEGAPWGLSQGIVVNGQIDDNFGYDGLENNYHTPEYERIYASRMGMKKRIVFLSKDYLEQENSYRISTTAYSLYLDSKKKYIPGVSLTISGVFSSCLVVYAGEDAALRLTSAEKIGPAFAHHYKKVFANSYTEMTLLALADTMMQIKAIGDAGFPNFNDFVPGFADGLHPFCATGNIRSLALLLQTGIFRSLQVASWYQSGWDLSPDYRKRFIRSIC